MTRIHLIFLVLLLNVHSPVCSRGTEESASETVEKLEEVQDKFFALALLLDDVRIDGLQYYPLPDWHYVNAEEERRRAYEEYATLWQARNVDEAYTKRIMNTAISSHWDAIRLYAPLTKRAIEQSDASEASKQKLAHLQSLAQGQLYVDPFDRNSLLGYIANESDYLLISVGPDLKSDILPFQQNIWGRYWDRGMEPTTTTLQLSVRELEESYFTIPPDQRGSLLVPPETGIYDPTNGIHSSGDIVFQRRGGDNWMFSFQSDLVFNEANLIPRDLEQQLGTRIRPTD